MYTCANIRSIKDSLNEFIQKKLKSLNINKFFYKYYFVRVTKNES